jgi:hypothetical protein
MVFKINTDQLLLGDAFGPELPLLDDITVGGTLSLPPIPNPILKSLSNVPSGFKRVIQFFELPILLLKNPPTKYFPSG